MVKEKKAHLPRRLGTMLCLTVSIAAEVTSSSLTTIFLFQRPIFAALASSQDGPLVFFYLVYRTAVAVAIWSEAW